MAFCDLKTATSEVCTSAQGTHRTNQALEVKDGQFFAVFFLDKL